jgi:hypothetical protein
LTMEPGIVMGAEFVKVPQTRLGVGVGVEPNGSAEAAAIGSASGRGAAMKLLANKIIESETKMIDRLIWSAAARAD